MKTAYWIFRILAILLGLSFVLDVIQFMQGTSENISGTSLVVAIISIVISVYFGKKISGESNPKGQNSNTFARIILIISVGIMIVSFLAEGFSFGLFFWLLIAALCYRSIKNSKTIKNTVTKIVDLPSVQ